MTKIYNDIPSVVLLVGVFFVTATASSPGFLAPNSRATGGLSDVVLCYIDARSINNTDPTSEYSWSPSKFSRLLAFHDLPMEDPESHPVDTLFDGILLIGYEWTNGKMFWPDTGSGGPMNKTDWSDFLDLVLDLGAANVDAAAGSLRPSLCPDGSCSAARPRLVLAIPYPDPLQRDFGDIDDGSGRSLDFANADDRLSAVLWWVDQAVSRLDARGLQHGTSLAGFYWFMESIQADDDVLLPAVADHIHGRLSPAGVYSFSWIPYYTSSSFEWYSNWRQLGFDFVTLQPNYAFHNTSQERFDQVRNLTMANNLGVELELPDYVRNPQVADWKTSFTQYLDHVSSWPGRIMRTYYYGNAFVTTFQANATVFDFYSQLFAFAKGSYPNAVPVSRDFDAQ